MTIEKQYSKKFNIFVEELLSDKEKYCSDLSVVDKALSDCLHFLENGNVNDDITLKVSKKLLS